MNSAGEYTGIPGANSRRCPSPEMIRALFEAARAIR
jgi:hypothetical protein